MEADPFVKEWTNQTTVHPVGFVALVCAGIAVILLPRRYALVPMIIVACFIAPAQRIAVLTLDFTFLRLIVLFGWVRLVIRSEVRGLTLRPLDWAMIAWAACGTFVYVVQRGTLAALIFKLGLSFDALGMYFLFRLFIRNWRDADTMVRAFILMSVPVAIAFLIEMSTGRNVFAVFGGVPQVTPEREGRLRCQGAFAHAILAGCFWASLMPLIAAAWWRGTRGRLAAVAGLACCCLMIVACASSTPVMAVGFGIIGAAAFPLRHLMRLVRWSLLLVLILLHMSMTMPVWHLIGRIDLIGGSTGYHRYQLIDAAVNHFDAWWLVGCTSTANWGRQLFDVTNQYVLEGVRGGVWTLSMFVVVIACAFRGVGRLMREAKSDRYREVFAWGVGVALLIHAVNFLAVSYFGQIFMVWYLTLALVGSLAPGTRRESRDLSDSTLRRGRSRGATRKPRTGVQLEQRPVLSVPPAHCAPTAR